MTVARLRSAARGGRWALAGAAVEHPRHVALGVALAGLLVGPVAPAPGVALVVAAAVIAVRAVPLAAPRAAAVAAGLLVIGAATFAQHRVAALERTELVGSFGREVSGTATLLTAPRADAFGGRRALVRWRGEPVLLRIPAWATARGPAVGAILRVRGRLRAPDLAARALRAHATLRATAVADTGRRRGGPAGVVDGIRRRAEHALGGGLPPSEAGLLRGMVLGEDAALPDDLRDAFRAAGLSHLVAASGQNVLLLAALALVVGMVAGLGVRGRAALVAALIALYVPLAGGGPSIQRAGIMGLAALAAVVAGRPASRWYAVLLAAVVTLALDPRSAGDVGWQLSFAAVLGILVLTPRLRSARPRSAARRLVGEAVAVTLAASVATAPLIALHFGRSSIVSLPANILAAPAVAPVMWLGMVAAAVGQLAPSLSAPLVALAGLPLGWLTGLARTAAALPGAQADLPVPAVVAACAALTALAIAWVRAPQAPRAEQFVPAVRRRFVAVGACAMLALVAVVVAARDRLPAAPAAGLLRITALDVGQGDATLLQAGGHAVLVDAGPAGAPVVARLREAGVRALDLLVVTHGAADHLGGAPAVLRALPVGALLDGRDGDRSPVPASLDPPLRDRRVPILVPHAGDELRAGPLSLRVLWPPPGRAAPGADANDRAIVARAGAYGGTVLLTSDAESPILQGLDLERVDVLKVSHHGSADPGLPAVLSRLDPAVALVEVGRHNTYGHPAPGTLSALRAVPALRRTDRDGTVFVDVAQGRPPRVGARR